MTQSTATSRTRDRIHEAAVELFYFHGFGGASLREIADLAGINVATVYYHYRSKNALLEEICRAVLHDALAGAKEVLDTHHDPAARLRGLVEGHVVFHCQRAKEAAVTDREVNSLPVNVRRELVRDRDSYEQIWDEVLSDGGRTRVFEIDDNKLLRMAALTMCSQVASWYDPKGRLVVEEIAAQYAKYVLRMAGYTAENALTSRKAGRRGLREAGPTIGSR